MSQYIHNRGKHVTSELHSLCQHHGKYNRGNEKHGGGVAGESLFLETKEEFFRRLFRRGLGDNGSLP